MLRRIKIKNAASIYEAMPVFQIPPPSSERREYYRDPLPLKEKTRAEEGVGIFICVALQRLDLSKTHGTYLFYVPLRNLEPVNLNPSRQRLD